VKPELAIETRTGRAFSVCRIGWVDRHLLASVALIEGTRGKRLRSVAGDLGGALADPSGH